MRRSLNRRLVGVAVFQRSSVSAKLHQAGCIGIRVWFVMPDPPLVGRRLRITLRRVFPFLLTPERGEVQVVPGVSHLLVAAAVNKVGAKNTVAVPDKCVRAVP